MQFNNWFSKKFFLTTIVNNKKMEGNHGKKNFKSSG